MWNASQPSWESGNHEVSWKLHCLLCFCQGGTAWFNLSHNIGLHQCQAQPVVVLHLNGSLEIRRCMKACHTVGSDADSWEASNPPLRLSGSGRNFPQSLMCITKLFPNTCSSVKNIQQKSIIHEAASWEVHQKTPFFTLRLDQHLDRGRGWGTAPNHRI